MALINCTECGKQISDKSRTCVHCGCPLSYTFKEMETAEDQKGKAETAKAIPADVEGSLETLDTKESRKNMGMVFCRGCGKEIHESAPTCPHCGAPQHKTDHGHSLDTPMKLKRISLFLIIMLNVITFGIYTPIWFLIQKNTLNNLNTKKKLKSLTIIFLLIIFVVTSILDLLDLLSFFGEFHPKTELWQFIGIIIMICQCFKIKHMLNDHFNLYLKREIPLSGVCTFLFFIFYLQYKINKILTFEERKRWIT